MAKFDRVVAIVLDSIGIGEAPDAAKYEDTGADTLGHIGDFLVTSGHCLICNAWGWVIFARISRLRGYPQSKPRLATTARCTKFLPVRIAWTVTLK